MSASGQSVSNPKKVRDYKLVCLGDGGVGKSALVIQFVCLRFLDYHDPTIEDSYQKQARIDGEPAMLDILDTAGQPEFNAMREQYMRKGEGFILCYSITDKRSFDEVVTYKKLIDRVRCRDDIPIILVGNKCDLEDKRKVSSEEGHALARQLRCPFYETSSVLRKCVDDVFHELVREIRRKEREDAELVVRLHKKKKKGVKGLWHKVFKKEQNRETFQRHIAYLRDILIGLDAVSNKTIIPYKYIFEQCVIFLTDAVLEQGRNGKILFKIINYHSIIRSQNCFVKERIVAKLFLFIENLC